MRSALAVCLTLCLGGLAPAGAQWPQDVPDVLNRGFAPAGPDQLEEAAAGESLKGRDLSGGAFAGLRLADQDLAGTTWQKTDLRGARYTNCMLDGADFSGAYLGGAAFEGCSLKDAIFTAASLRGAYFKTCDFSGATFDGADIAGMSLIDITLSPTGAPYLPALRTAIELRGGAAYQPALIAAAAGDAFSFTYNRADRAAWCGMPMTFHPLLEGLDTLGFDATTPKAPNPETGTARKDLTAVLRRGLVGILPLRLSGAGLDGDAVEGPVWVVAHEITADEGDEQVHVSTPFGPMALSMDDLLRRWRGPWPTLAPMGETLTAARFPLCTVGALKAEVTEQSATVEALRNASAILNEARSFGEASGGLQAYQALIRDMGDEQVSLADLMQWSDGPRLGLAASRHLAAEFLRDAAPKAPEAAQRLMLQAAELYLETAALLTDQWPLTTAEAGAGSRATATVTLQSALDRERRAVVLLDQAVEAAGH